MNPEKMQLKALKRYSHLILSAVNNSGQQLCSPWGPGNTPNASVDIFRKTIKCRSGSQLPMTSVNRSQNVVPLKWSNNTLGFSSTRASCALLQPSANS